MHRSFYLLILCLILLIKAFGMAFFIHSGSIGLGPDEAQYWTWSQALNWGYYSKPPGIAWQIWSGTQIFGNTELGVRFGSIVFSFILGLCIYGLALSCKLRPHTAFWAALAFSLSPVGLLSSLFAITDVGLVLFWTLGCWLIISAIAENRPPDYYGLGFIILLGALFKWPIYLLWLFVLIFMPFYRNLFSKHFFSGVLISLLGLLPTVYWNYHHDWATFRHVSATVFGRHDIADERPKSNFLDFIGAQAALMSPILFALFIAGCFYLLFIWISHRKKAPQPHIKPLAFCASLTFLSFLSLSLMAIYQKVQGNWAVFAFPTAFVFLSWYALEATKRGWIWFYAGVVLALGTSLFALSLPYIQTKSLWEQMRIPYKINPLKHNLGWSHLTKVLEESGYDPRYDFLFGDKYQTTSVLSFYSPGQKRAYFLNLHGIRNNQFSYWPSMADEQLGRTGFFVVTENSPHLERRLPELIDEYQSLLQPYFEKVEFLGVAPLYETYEVMAKGALIFKCVKYNGLSPSKTNLY